MSRLYSYIKLKNYTTVFSQVFGSTNQALDIHSKGKKRS